MNCKDCKHFIRLNGTENSKIRTESQNEKVGECEIAVTDFRQQGGRFHDTVTYGQVPDIKDSTALYGVSEWGDEVAVIVGEDFGCIKFEGKGNN